MREIVVISGKGGTGKTSVTAALACIANENLVLADCDVDAADLHLILNPKVRISEDFFSGVKAEINTEICVSCGKCAVVCRFSAIEKLPMMRVNPLDCEGCGYCYHVCPVQAIHLPIQRVGKCYVSDTRFACTLVHAKLGIGADNSGKLVAKVKREAKQAALKEKKDYILVDGSPGIGCPVISSLSGASFVLLVTEPSLSALDDVTRVWKLVNKFGIPAGCIINKADINPEVADRILMFLSKNGIAHISNLPYDEDFHKAITEGMNLIEYNRNKWYPIFERIWNLVSKEEI